MAPWLKKVEMLRAGEETTKRPRKAMAVRLRMKVVLRGVLRVMILSGIFFFFWPVCEATVCMFRDWPLVALNPCPC